MEKYNKTLFQQLLRGELSTEQVQELSQDPVFEEEFQFYLTFKEAGNQLKKKYLEPETTTPVEPEVIPFPKNPSWWQIAAAIMPVLVGIFVVYNNRPIKTLGGESTPLLSAMGWVGVLLITVGVGLLLFFFKKRS
jgi:hypothetical protein